MEQFISDVMKLREKVNKLYIYGIGLYGRTTYQTLSKYEIKIDGFMVTSNREHEKVWGIPVFETKDIISDQIGIVLGLNKFNTIEVLEYLKQNNFDMSKVIYRNEFVRNAGRDCNLDQNPMIEITTRIGCKVNCYYCPQSVLLNSYFKNDKNRKMEMDINDFKTCLDKLPINCDIIFCGMSEPLLNSQCIKMMQMACATGRRVELFTTLVGAKMEDIDKIISMPLNLVTLHVADKFGHAQIPVSQEYYEMVEKMISAKRKDGTPLVNNCSAQEEADEQIKKICEGRCEIVTVLHDRAGNLESKGIDIMTQKGLQGKISCSFCSSKMNRNILLPDGTVLLCCMDYGMKHSLGNLLEDTYDEIMNSQEMQKVKHGINGDMSLDILCRNCSQAHEIR